MVDRIREKIVEATGDPTLSMRQQWDRLRDEIQSLSTMLDDLTERVRALENR